MKKIYIIFIIGLFLISSNTIVTSSYIKRNNLDYDPLVDISVTVDFQTIRFLEDEESSSQKIRLPRLPQIFINKLLGTKLQLSLNNDPSLYLKVIINDNEFISNTWSSSRYIYNPDWSVTFNVPDDQEFVDIKIQLFDSSNVLYDISGDTGNSDDAFDVEISYDIKTGHWSGDDEMSDPSGYGRLCGCDDGSMYKVNKDSEIWFNIYQNDYDNDGIPYWMEINEYQTNPEVPNSGDPDNDKIPVDWEWKWGYNPFSWDDHENLDSDGDSINNYEEYLTSEWFSDPFRKDVFVEMDKMSNGPNGEEVNFPEISKELFINPFDRQNIVMHLDSGKMGGYEIIPFDELSTSRELKEFYNDYFLHGDKDNWRRGVFHYGVVVYHAEGVAGYVFRPNAWQVSSLGMEEKSELVRFQRNIVFASSYMHELGHTFAFWPIPGHNDESKYPWQPGYWQNRPYKSCMNYAWVYQIVDYSDGSRSAPDIDDWSRIDYSHFEHEWG